MPYQLSLCQHVAAGVILWASLAWCGSASAEQPYQADWITQFGTTRSDWGHAVATDDMGSIFVTGSTTGDLAGSNAGYEDVFINKFDRMGNVLWSRQVGTSRSDFSRAIAVDAWGNAYISGYTDRSLGGPSIGSEDVFLIKYDTAGQMLWSRQTGTTDNDRAFSLATDGSGNIYITGSSGDSLYGPSGVLLDAFLMKYDSGGNELWSRQIGTVNGDAGRAVAIDELGNIYITGITVGSLGGAHQGLQDAFLMKMDPSGNELWSRQIGTVNDDKGYSIALDPLGGVYITGGTTGDLEGPNAGLEDAFIVRYDASGNQLWTRQMGLLGVDRSYSVATDASGNAYITGYTEGDLSGTNGGQNNGEDVFLTKFDPSGDLLWTYQFGTDRNDIGNAVTVDSTGYVYITGSTSGHLDGAGPITTFSADAFLIILTVPEPISAAWLILGGSTLLFRPRCPRL